AVCGRIEADLHHTPALGVPYEQDTGLLTGFIPLCREHHSLAHSIGLTEFENRYHLQGVWLNPTMIMELKKVYPGHFKAFKKENYE
ncbi:MAG: putative HNHc nuclease, partial [Cetobacterium sp.]